MTNETRTGTDQLRELGLSQPIPARRGLRVVLPFPPAELSPNARCHWREKAAAVQAYRYECKVEALRQTLGETWAVRLPLDIELTFVLKDKRRRDWDNLLASFKAGIDGLVDAGLLPDDDVRSWSPTLHYEQGNKPAVRVDINTGCLLESVLPDGWALVAATGQQRSREG